MGKLDAESTGLLVGVRGGNDNDPAKFGVQTYHSQMALAMTINYIIGTGCLGLPYAFREAGLVLTTLFLLFGFVVSVVTMNYTLEVLARAQGMYEAGDGSDGKPVRHPQHVMKYRKWDFSTIAQNLSGEKLKMFVQTTLVFYCFTTLWSYSNVFSSSAATLFHGYVLGDHCNIYDAAPLPSPSCMISYYFAMLVFAVIVITLILRDLSDQARVQQVLTIYRITALCVMIVTISVKMYSDGSDVVFGRINMIGNFNWTKFGKGFGPTVLAINCHYNMPDAMQPLSNKTQARAVAFGALTLTCLFYFFLAFGSAVAFDVVNPLASLNWADYSGCGNGWSPCAGGTGMFGISIQLLVLMFPVCNVASAFPMVGVTMADNMFVSVPRAMIAQFGEPCMRTVCRLLAAIPPLLLALAVKKLDFILTIAGLLGFLLGFTIPSVFQILSINYCERLWGSRQAAWTLYTSFATISSKACAKVVVCISIFFLIVSIASLFITEPSTAVSSAHEVAMVQLDALS